MVFSLQVFRPQFCKHLISPMRATCLANLILLDLITLIFCEAYSYEAPPASHHFLPLRPNFSPQHPVLKHLQSTVHSSVTVRDQVSHPYETTGNIIVLYVFSVDVCPDKNNALICESVFLLFCLTACNIIIFKFEILA